MTNENLGLEELTKPQSKKKKRFKIYLFIKDNIIQNINIIKTNAILQNGIFIIIKKFEKIIRSE